MAQQQVFATKGNLMTAKKFLSISKLGYELLDRKRNILIRELMMNMETAKSLRGVIESTYQKAYDALQEANITLGIIDKVAHAVPVEDSVSVTYKSVMGVEVPLVKTEPTVPELTYGFHMTNSQLDNAYINFDKVKNITVTLAEVENSIYRLSTAIKKTQMRANALKNILIPQFQAQVKFITDSLEEKEREEFSRLKVIKVRKNREAEEALKKSHEISEARTKGLQRAEKIIAAVAPEALPEIRADVKKSKEEALEMAKNAAKNTSKKLQKVLKPEENGDNEEE